MPHLVLDLEGMDANLRCDRVDRRIGDVAKAALKCLHDIHEPRAVGPEFLDDGVAHRRNLLRFLAIRHHHR